MTDQADTAKTDEEFEQPVRKEPVEETSSASITKDVVPAEYRKRYAEGNGTCGDFIATEISAITKEGGVPAINGIKNENGIPVARWSDLNNGMQRMNLANTLRAQFLRGEPVKIGGKEYDLRALATEFADDTDPLDVTKESDLAKFIEMVDLQDTERTRKAIVKTLGPQPEKPVRKTAEEREAEKAAKAAEKQAARDKVKAEREAAAAAKVAEREAAKKAADEAKAKAKADRDAAAKVKADEAAKAKADKEAKAAAAKADAAKAAEAKASAKAVEAKAEEASKSRKQQNKAK